MLALQGCPPYRGAHLTGVPTLQRCPPYRGAHLRGVPTLQGCPPYRGAHLTGVPTLQGCPPYRGAHLTGVSTLQGCPSYRGVYLGLGGWDQMLTSVNKRPSWLTLVTRLNKNMCSRNLHGYQACCGLNEQRVWVFLLTQDELTE